MATEKIRTRIVDALMALAAERPYRDVSLTAVAERAELPLATLREAFDSRTAILAEFARRIDRQVLAGIGETTEESARDRLFEVMMRRFDLLAPHRPALRSIGHAARRDPGFALALNAIALVSQGWMLEAAGIDRSGPRGLVKAQGLAVVYARAMEAWLSDEEGSLDRTMAALDKGLRRGESALGRLDTAAACLCRPLRVLASLRRSGRAEPQPPPAEAA